MTAFAIMRSGGRMGPEGRRTSAALAVCCGLGLGIGFAYPSAGWPATNEPAAGAGSEPASAVAATPDSTSALRPQIAWLPIPVEDVEAPDLLDRLPSDPLTEISMRAVLRAGRFALTRVATESIGQSTRVAVSAAGWSGGEAGATIVLHSDRARLDVATGALVARGAGVLLGTKVGFSRRATRPPAPRVGIATFDAPASASSEAIVGVGLSREGSGSAAPGFWLVAGRRDSDRTLLGALGAVTRVPRGSIGIAAGALGGAFAGSGMGQALGGFSLRHAAGSLSASLRSGGAAVAGEWLLTQDGFAALLEAGSAPGPLLWSGRWRYESRNARPASAEVLAETGTPRARARLTMASGPTGTSAAMAGSLPGLVELEGRWTPPRRGPVLFRVGRSGDQRYAVFDATVARGAGRTLAVLATRRERPASSGGARIGSSLGGRLNLARRGASGLELLVEAVRADPAAGAEAWSSGLYATGATTLRSLRRSGVLVSARGWIRLGRVTLGGLLTSVEDAPGRHTTAATIWLERRAAGGGR